MGDNTVTQLVKFVIGALLVATVSVGLTGFISEGLNTYSKSSNVDTDGLKKLERVSNATDLADKAQQRAENVNAKSDFFTLPGLVKTFKLAFDSIGLWDIFISTSLNILGLNKVSWPAAFATGAVTIAIAFIFARRILN